MDRIKIKLFLLTILVATYAYAQLAPDKKTDSFTKGSLIKVPATTGISEKSLGQAFDKDFKNLNIKSFDNSEISSVDEGQYDAEISIIENHTSLTANANFLGLVKAGVSSSNKQRFAILSIYNVTKTVTINPSSEIKDNADMFIKKIYYGWSINYIITGSSSNFNSDVKIALSRIISSLPEVNLDYTLGEYKLDKKLKLIGLKNKSENPPIVLNPNDVPNYFQVSEKFVPIFVEYEVIKDFNTEQIKFESSNVVPGKYKLKYITIEISNLKPSLNVAWDALGGLPDPYLKILINGKAIATSNKIQDTLNATFDVNKTIQINEGDKIEIIATDADVSEHDFIGSASITYEELSKKKINTEIDLQTSDGHGLNSVKILLTPIEE